MPEQSQSQTPAPAPAQAPTPAPTNQSQSQGSGKKSNACLIIVIIGLVVLVLLGVGGYLAYRYAKNKVNKALNSATSTSSTSSTTESSDSATNTANSIADTFNSAKDITPVSAIGAQINAEVKATISGVFGGAKLSSEMDLGSASSLTYTIKRQITTADYTAVETAFIGKGWVKVGSYNTDSGFSLDFTKNNISLSVSGNDKGQEVSATASQAS